MVHYASLFVCLLGIFYCTKGEMWNIPVENWYTTVRGSDTFPALFGKQAEATLPWGIDYALKNLSANAQNIDIQLEFYDSEFRSATALELLIGFVQEGHTISVGNPLSGVLATTGQAAAVYGISQMSATSTSASISNKSLYPYTLRTYAPTPFHAGALVSTILSYYHQEGIGWEKIALLCTTESYGISMANSFITSITGIELELLAYQQFLIGASDITVEMREIKNSGARVIVTFAIQGYEDVLREAEEIDLLDDHHVFFVGPNIASDAGTYTFDNGTIDVDTVRRLRGTIGTLAFLPRSGSLYDDLERQWIALDPIEIPGAGVNTVPGLSPMLIYDMAIALGLGIVEAEKQGFTPTSPPSAQQWVNIIQPLSYEGVSGKVEYDQNGDRSMPIALVNFNGEELVWSDVAIWSQDEGTIFNGDTAIIWNDGSTIVPDLDIRPAFDYWSCSDKKQKKDETGKQITLETPDGSDFDDIDIDYHCDNFIDCHNFSDESYDCTSNYMIIFIVFGIVTGLLILLTCCLIPFVVVFGFITPRKRIKASSPLFLLIILFSSIIGFASTFAWYGKPHPVACTFQPWLLGFSVISLISALSAKTWRMWRIFRKSLRRTVISRAQIFVLYLVMVVPAVFILIIWAIISTPTADIEERDNVDHYVCTTGGFTGKPGGIVFFAILVAYNAIVLLFGIFLSIVTRNVPSFFNESKLVAISMYNLAFLSFVVIPVFLVLQEYNPFAAWIIRTVAILYAFSATVILQFLPKVVGVIVLDKGSDSSPITVTAGVSASDVN